MQYQALIADDEKGARDSLEQLIKQHCPEISVAGKASDIKQAKKMIAELDPDLVFLDIEMPGGNGFDLLEQIEDKDFAVIFTTAYDQFAIKAIRFSAIDYLLKPIDPDELKRAVATFIEKSKNRSSLDSRLKVLVENMRPGNRNKKIALPEGDGLSFVALNDIIRCDSDGSYTNIFLTDGRKIMVSRPIGDFEELLSDESFFRVHRSHLINMLHIKKYMKGDGGYVIMDDDAPVEVSRRKKNDFMDAMLKL